MPMSDAKFESAIHNLYEYFDRKPPTFDKKRAVLKRVQYIPDEAVDWIVDKIQDEMDSLPRNIGKAFKLNYQAWQSSNTGKVHTYKQEKCDQCKGTGLLWYSYFDEDFQNDIEKVAVCGDCENWRQFGPLRDSVSYVTTRQELIARGFAIEGPTKDLPKTTFDGSVKDMASVVGQRIKNESTKREAKHCCDMAKHGGHAEDCPNNIRNLPREKDMSHLDDLPF